MTSGSVSLGRNTNLYILGGGVLEITGDTRFAGNSSQINVYGQFDTNSLTISGGSRGVALNTFGDAVVNINSDVTINGDASLQFGGNSTINVGGDINLNGNSGTGSDITGLILSDNASLNISGDLIAVGNSLIEATNNSEILVVGNVVLKGNTDFILDEQAILIVQGGCGTYEDADCLGGLFVEGNAAFIESDIAQAYICGQKPAPNAEEGASVTIYCDPSDPTLIPGNNCALYTSCRILPVEFIETKVQFEPELRITKINFTTAKEWKNSHFEIERSVNDTRSWTKVGEVTGQGYSDVPVEYSFTDFNLPPSGGNIFYRLKQVDFDLDFQYSVTRSIQVKALDGSTSWIVYPNPSAMRSSITVDILDRSVYADETVLIRISDARGIFQSYSASNPNEVSAIVNSYLDEARPGMFILQLVWGNNSEQVKLIRK